MTRKILLSAAILLFASTVSYSQISVKKILKNVQKNTERKIENKIEKKLNAGVDTVLDGTERGIKGVVKGDGKSNDKSVTPSQKDQTQKDQNQPKPVVDWNRFDFIPGNEVIFEDNMQNEKNGEFPSKWDLFQGNFEISYVDGQAVINCIECNMNSGGGIVPLMKNSKSDYLPDEFTVEFDLFFEGGNRTAVLYLLDYKNQQNLDRSIANSEKYINFKSNSISGHNITTSYYPGFSGAKNDNLSKWRHISVSFNKRALKVYMDDTRLVNIPNLNFNPTGISIGFHMPSGGKAGYLKNVRIAKGAVPLYDKMLTDGKFVTTGIKFDVNKAVIKQESMGVINYVFKMMSDNPDLNFSVEGHTDSDGDDSSNLTLSQQRAKAVADMLVSMGIEQKRLTAKGWGESKPVNPNDTPEGKANNRRVEFVKF